MIDNDKKEKLVRTIKNFLESLGDFDMWFTTTYDELSQDLRIKIKITKITLEKTQEGWLSKIDVKIKCLIRPTGWNEETGEYELDDIHREDSEYEDIPSDELPNYVFDELSEWLLNSVSGLFSNIDFRFNFID